MGWGNSDSVFSDAKSLKKVVFADGMTKIPANALRNCSSVTEVVIPDSVTAIDYDAFCGCTGLKSVTIPANVTKIGNDAFRGCTVLKSVTIPSNVTSIGSYAFDACTGLKSVTIPDSVTTIGSYAFSGCTNLSSVTLNNGLKSIGYGAFNNTAIMEITIPKSVESMGWGNSDSVFSDAKSLKKVVFADGMTKIPAYALRNCSSVTEVVIPDSVTLIGSNAFLNCTNLVARVSSSSEIINYLIKNDIPFTVVNNEEQQSASGSILNPDNTSYEFLTQSIVNGSATVVVKYDLKDSDGVTDMNVIILLPNGAEFMPSTLHINDATSSDYTLKDNQLNIPVGGTSGTLKFSIKLPSNSILQSTAKLSYAKNGVSNEENIGVLTSITDLLTINVPSVTDSASVTVSGVAPAKSEVEIKIDGVAVAKTTASANGVYSTSITIPSPTDLASYEISASTKISERTTESTALLTYYEDEVVDVSEFKLYYNNHSNSSIDLLNLNGKKPTISFNPSCPMTFVVDTKDNSQVEKIYIVSTKNNEIKKIEAVYDEATGKFIASGYFEPNNHHYVPGKLSVEYSKKSDPISFEPITAYTEAEYKTYITDNGITYSYNEVSDDEISYTFTIDGKQYTQTLKKEDIYDTVTGGLADLTDYYAKKNGFDEIIDGNDVKYFAKIISPYTSGSDKFKKAIQIFKNHDSQIVTLFFDEDVGEAYKYLKKNVAKPAGTAYDMLKDIYTGAKNESKLYDAYWNFYSDSSHSESQRKAGTNMYNYGYLMNGLSVIGKVGIGLLTLTGTAIAGPWGIAAGIVFGAMDYIAQETIKGLNGEEAYSEFINAFAWLNWLVDPSGYVYEAVDTNRLEGVKTTIYFKDTKTGTAKIWDATEYDQANPLTTASDGSYAWDVPEGEWQVKYEKDGYETAYSEWLPVPPPQLDVNIGLVSTQSPMVELVKVYEDYAEIKFSQYMDAASVTSDTVKFSCGGKNISVKITPENAENKPGDKNTKYATLYKVEFTGGKQTSPVSVAISGVKSYCGKTLAENYNSTVDVQIKITDINIPESIKVDYSKGGTITVNATPAAAVAGKTLKVTLGNSFTVEPIADVVFDNSGKAVINIKPEMPGAVDVKFTVVGTTTEIESVLQVVYQNTDTCDHVDNDKNGVCDTCGLVANIACKHSYKDVVTAATCTKQGYTTHTCTLCGATKVDTYVDALGHKEVTDKAVAATCTATGLTEGAHCSICNTIIRKQESTKALGHDFTDTARTNADGSISYKCTRCNEYGGTVKPSDKKLDPVKGTKRLTQDNIDILAVPVEVTANTVVASANGGKLVGKDNKEITDTKIPLTTGMKVMLGSKSVTISVVGDVDSDGTISVSDARLALRAAVKLETFTGAEFIAANVDFKDDISVSDARLVLRAAVKLDNPRDWLK